MSIIILVISQFMFGLSRTLNVKYISIGNIPLSMLTSFLIKATWLVSSAIGVKSVLDGDFTTALVYIASAMFGDYVALKMKK
jgi:hypothetical protein